MGGFFGVASKKNCTLELFYGVDYHSHLGTRRGGMALFGEEGFQRAIHNLSLIHIQMCIRDRDIYGKYLSGLGGAVQFWVLQPDAYIASHRSDRYAPI